MDQIKFRSQNLDKNIDHAQIYKDIFCYFKYCFHQPNKNLLDLKPLIDKLLPRHNKEVRRAEMQNLKDRISALLEISFIIISPFILIALIYRSCFYSPSYDAQSHYDALRCFN